MIFINQQKMWFRLQQAVALENSVQFAFQFGAFRIECIAEVQQQGMLLTGRLTSRTTARTLDQDVRWTAERPPLFGNWKLTTKRDRLLQLSRLEGDFAPWLAKIWDAGRQSKWHTGEKVIIPNDYSKVGFEAAGTVYTATLAASKLSMSGIAVDSLAGINETFIANRLSSGIS